MIIFFLSNLLDVNDTFYIFITRFDFIDMFIEYSYDNLLLMDVYSIISMFFYSAIFFINNISKN